MIGNLIKRQYQNVSLLGAYTIFDFMKQAFLFPVDYYLRSGRSSFPINITLALTLRCNAKCSMCALSELLNVNDREISLEQYRNFIDRWAKNKPGFVLYGGEPFLRSDILEIIRIIKNYGLSCGVFTNGLLLNKDILKEIIQLRMNFMVFSLYGPKEIHDKIVGVKGAYDKIIENAAFLKKHRKNTKVIIHCTVSKDNIKYLDEILNIAFCDKVRFGHLTFLAEQEKQKVNQELKDCFPGEEIYLKSLFFNPDTEKLKDFQVSLSRLRAKGDIQFTPELSIQEIADWYSPVFKTRRKCLFIWRGVFIAPNGDVYPCMGNFYYKMGNIINQDLVKVWNSDKFVNFRLNLRKRLLTACSRCCRL